MRKNPSNRKVAKKKKTPLASAFAKRLEKVLPVGIPLLFFGSFFFFLSQAAFHFLAHSPYFSIETVEAHSSRRQFPFRDPSLMGSLLGRNIFKVNLPNLQEEISRKHPELLSTSVRREFPNKVKIFVVPRLPVAQVQDGGTYLVDQDGIILPYVSSPSSFTTALPLVVGVGERKGLQEALHFTSSLHQLPELARYVRIIDVSDENNLSFRTPEGLEVRVGSGDFKEKLKLFDRTRVTLGDRMKEIKYLDLRFDEVVIGSR